MKVVDRVCGWLIEYGLWGKPLKIEYKRRGAGWLVGCKDGWRGRGWLVGCGDGWVGVVRVVLGVGIVGGVWR